MIPASHSKTKLGNCKSDRLSLGKAPSKRTFSRTLLSRNSRMWKASGFVQDKQMEKSQRRRIKTHQKASTLNSSIANFKVHPCFATAQLLAPITQHVPSTLDDLGQECVPGDTLHRIIFIAMVYELEVTDNPTKTTTCVSKQPRHWMFVGRGSEKSWSYDMWEAENMNGNWDRKALNIFQQTKNPPSRSRHRNFLSRNPQTEKGKKKAYTSTRGQSPPARLQADRIGEPPKYPYRRHELHG